MQHHFVVYFDDVTKTWHIDEGTTQARFEDGNVWVEDKKKFLEGEWQDSNDTTSDALDNLRELIEIDSESDEPIQTEAYQDIDPDSTYGSFLSPLDDLDEWGNDLIEETDYLEEDDE